MYEARVAGGWLSLTQFNSVGHEIIVLRKPICALSQNCLTQFNSDGHEIIVLRKPICALSQNCLTQFNSVRHEIIVLRKPICALSQNCPCCCLWNNSSVVWLTMDVKWISFFSFSFKWPYQLRRNQILQVLITVLSCSWCNQLLLQKNNNFLFTQLRKTRTIWRQEHLMMLQKHFNCWSAQCWGSCTSEIRRKGDRSNNASSQENPEIM